MQKEEMKRRAKQVSSFIKKLIEEVRTVPLDMRKRRMKIKILNESGILEAATDFLEKELGTEVSVYNETDSNKYDPRDKAVYSKPYRPAIFIE
jgi:leucyl-tRNA synthetase